MSLQTAITPIHAYQRKFLRITVCTWRIKKTTLPVVDEAAVDNVGCDDEDCCDGNEIEDAAVET